MDMLLGVITWPDRPRACSTPARLSLPVSGDPCWARRRCGPAALDVPGRSRNGLLLSAIWDAAFEKGLVSFADDGMPLISSLLSDAARATLGLGTARPIAGLRDGHRANPALLHHARNGF